MKEADRQDAKGRLPEGWRWVRLGDAGEIASGVTLGRRVGEQPVRAVPYLRVAKVKDGHLDLGEVYEIEATKNEIVKLRLRRGDLLLTEGGDPDKLGRGTIWSEELPECIHQNHIFRVRFDTANVFPEFASFQIASPQGKAYFLSHAKRTTGIATINQKVLAGFPLSVPPIEQQLRIAAVLKEQMVAVERARKAAEARLEAAKALPAAILENAFAEHASGIWPMRRLGDLIRLRKEIVHPRDNPTGKEVFVGLEHIEPGAGRCTGGMEVKKEELTGRKPKFYTGDIVYGYLRPYLNKVWVAEFNGLCSVDQYVYSVDQATADTEFVAWYMRSKAYLRRAPVAVSPGQLPRIRTEEVASTEIPLPGVAEQRRVVGLIRAKTVEGERLRKAAEAELAAINALPAALLRRAFSGAL